MCAGTNGGATASALSLPGPARCPPSTGRPWSVPNAIFRRDRRGRIAEDPNRFLLRTDEGKRITELAANNFENLRRVFELVLGLSKDQALAGACKMEHPINIETGERLQKLTEMITAPPNFHAKVKRQMAKIDSDD